MGMRVNTDVWWERLPVPKGKVVVEVQEAFHSRPLELYPLYKCRAGHLVFSKVAVSQVWHDTIGTTWHWQNTLSAEQGCWQNTLSAEQGRQQNTLSAEQGCRQNCFSGNVGLEPTTTVAQHVIRNLTSA